MYNTDFFISLLKKISDINKRNRSKYEDFHCMGTKSLPRFIHEVVYFTIVSLFTCQQQPIIPLSRVGYMNQTTHSVLSKPVSLFTCMSISLFLIVMLAIFFFKHCWTFLFYVLFITEKVNTSLYKWSTKLTFSLFLKINQAWRVQSKVC